MKVITFDSNFGRFAYRATAEIGDDVNSATTNLALRGIADTCFRGMASEVEKALVKAGFATKEQKRSEIAYSDDAAATVTTAANAKLAEICKGGDDGDGALPTITVTVTGEHVFGEQEASRKTATALWESIQTESDDQKRAGMLLTIGASEDTSDEDGIELAHKFLNQFRAPRKPKSK